MNLGKIGVWTFQMEVVPPAKAVELAREIESLGYGAIWIPEALGREALTHSALLLSGTERIPIATGIANIFARDPMAMAGAWKTLSSAWPDRFVLGLGVSHAPLVEGVRGHRYEKPLTAMKEYLAAMDSAPYMSTPPKRMTRVLGALAPKMLALSASAADGAHTYNVTPEHTASTREIVGPDKILAVEQAVLLEKDAARARELGRKFLETYLGLPNYANNLKRLGFGDDDFANGGSDRLVDSLIAWGDVDDARARVQAHLDAGASHVCVQALTESPTRVALEEWKELAPALL